MAGQTIFYARAVAGAVREIARILNVSEGTVHSRLHYAHRKLRDRLAQQPTEPEKALLIGAPRITGASKAPARLAR